MREKLTALMRKILRMLQLFWASVGTRPTPAWIVRTDAKIAAWTAAHPKIGAWVPASPEQVTPKNRKAVLILLAVLLLFPIPRVLHDGGSVEFRSATYSVVWWEFYKGDKVPDPDNKIRLLRVYPAAYCAVRDIWERQGDQAEKLGCFTYHVKKKTYGGKTTWVYQKTINGYRTNSMIYVPEGEDKSDVPAGQITRTHVWMARRMLDLGLYRMDRNVGDVARMYYPDGWRESVWLVRVTDVEGFTEQLIPVKWIDPWPGLGRHNSFGIDLRTGEVLEEYPTLWTIW